MLRRIGLRRSFLLAALVLGSAACDDESPTLPGDDLFPGGRPPETREVIVPAGALFRARGVFTDYTDPGNVPYAVVANRYAGELSSNALYRTARAFPAQLTYTQDNVNRSDTVYRAVNGTLVLRVDSALSTAGPVTLQVFRAAQDWHAPTATWELAADTNGVRTPWRTPGGTKGELLSSSVYRVTAAGDSVVIPLDSADINALRDTTGFGFILSAAEPGARIHVSQTPILRAGLRPGSPVRDTVVETTLPIDVQPQTFVFTPEPPRPAGVLAAGGLRSARTLFDLTIPDSVTGCNTAGQACARVALRDVRLNRVSLLLRRTPISPAFAPLDSTLLSLFSVTEPELGRFAPLGALVLDLNSLVTVPRTGFLEPQRVAVFAPGDTDVELNLTSFATAAARGDTVPKSFALLGGPAVGVGGARANNQIYDSFGLAAFAPEPRLRIVYTLPVRSELP